MKQLLDLKIEKFDNISVITIIADHLDAGNVDDFHSKIDPILADFDRVVFDFSNLSFIDSSGLGAILFCQRDIISNNGILKICGVSKSIKLFFELVRMHKVVDIEKTRDEAVLHFQQELNNE